MGTWVMIYAGWYKLWFDPDAFRDRQPRPDVGLTEALAFAHMRRWGIDRLRHEDGRLEDFAFDQEWRRLRQLAFEGDIQIWGREGPHGLEVPISGDYWRDHQPEWFSLIDGMPHTEYTRSTSDTRVFWHLRANKAQIKKAYPLS